jgi:hypothetical protein
MVDELIAAHGDLIPASIRNAGERRSTQRNDTR